MPTTKEYLRELERRKRESRVYQRHQLDGLEISQILDDKKHKTLYIKLAKQHDPNRLRQLAKTVAEKKDVRNKGAYFMSCLNKSNKLND
ncbi:MAG: hypothetical protein V1856_00875 [Candidatus Liptonbacteria bacterium]